MSRKALKVLVELKFRAVSCPGVHLPAKDELYLSMCFMGQYSMSQSLPAAFPLWFHEKMTFEKIFRHAVDPADIAVMLEYEMVTIKLVQLIRPVANLMAYFEEDARSFLFPEPKLVPCFSGMDREVLMTRTPHFPGIAPRLEFSTKTTIIECSADAEINIYPNIPMTLTSWPGACRSSPPQLSAMFTKSSSSLTRSPSKERYSPHRWQKSSSNGLAGEISKDDSSYSQTYDTLDYHQGPDLSGCSYRQQTRHSRSLSSSYREWEEVQARVRGLLMTPKAVSRLAYGATHSEVDMVLARRFISPGPP